MFDKIKNIFKSDKEENNVTPKNAPKEVTVPAHKIGPKSQDDTTTYVIIGASIAGVTAVKTLRELDKGAKIIVISKDENIYSRCMLHHLISGHRTIEGINFVDGNIEDAIGIKEQAKYAKNIVIMGAGLVGMDALAGLVEIDGIGNLSLIASEDRILDKQLDVKAAKAYEDKFEQKGVKIYKNRMASEVLIDEDGKVKGINLGNDEIIDCDLLVVSTGVRSNIGLVEGSGIETEKGIKINEKGETNKPDIYAAGDVTGTGIWPLATKQAEVAATNMAGGEAVIEDRFEFKNTMNFLGIPTVSVGFITPPDDTYDILTYTDGDNYKMAVIKDDVLIGFIAQGDISYVGPYTQLVKEKIKVDNLAKRVFELGYSDFFKIKEDGQFEW